MKPILFFISLLLVSLILFMFNFPIYSEQKFTPERTINAKLCKEYMVNRAAFQYCVTVLVICKDKIIKNPIGKNYGILALMSTKKEDGTIIWVEKIFASNMTDTESKKWCEDNINN